MMNTALASLMSAHARARAGQLSGLMPIATRTITLITTIAGIIATITAIITTMIITAVITTIIILNAIIFAGYY